MMRRENGRVLIDISEEDYQRLLVTLGFALGSCGPIGSTADGIRRLVNVINEGNPQWTPYEVPA